MVSKVDHTVCRLWFQKLTILSTMLSNVDHTVDSRDFKKRNSTVATSRLSIFRGFCCRSFSSDFSAKVEEFVRNGLKIFKSFRQSQQSTTWPIRDPAPVDFSRESWPYCRLWFQKFTILSTMVSKIDRTVDYGFKSWPDCRQLYYFSKRGNCCN